MNKTNTPHRQQAYRLVALQAIVAGVVAVCWLVSSWTAAVSALLGGGAVVLPSLYFAYRFFAVTHARSAQRIIRAFYWGELTKLLLSAFLVIAISRLWPKLVILPFFSDFAATYLGFWLAPLVMRK
jgi:ATP synthase protein I